MTLGDLAPFAAKLVELTDIPGVTDFLGGKPGYCVVDLDAQRRVLPPRLRQFRRGSRNRIGDAFLLRLPEVRRDSSSRQGAD
jgi:hypothetical protein